MFGVETNHTNFSEEEMLLKIKGPSKRTESGANFTEVKLGENGPVKRSFEGLSCVYYLSFQS